MLYGTNFDDVYFLTGLVNYYGSEDSKSDLLGHFTAFCFQNNAWLEFNDEKLDNPLPHNEDTIIKPRLLFYLKQK